MTAPNTPEKFWRKVNKTETCWLWTGSVIHCGYGRFWFHGARILAHRFAYEDAVGPIPDGLELDHLCRVRACVRPSHLEPVTREVNVERMKAARTRCGNDLHEWTPENIHRAGGQNHCRPCLEAKGRLRATPRDPNACAKGHPYDEANTYRTRSGSRACRTCMRGWQKAYQLRKREAA